MNKLDIENLKKWKSHADFYRSMIQEFYDKALSCGEFDEDRLYDWFYNNVITLDELLEDQEITDESISLEYIKEHDDGSADFIFDYTEEFVETVRQATGIENPTREDIGDYIRKVLIEASEEIIEDEKNGKAAPF